MQKMDDFVLAAFADKMRALERLRDMLQEMKQHLKQANSGQGETLRAPKKELVELESANNRLDEAVKKISADGRHAQDPGLKAQIEA